MPYSESLTNYPKMEPCNIFENENFQPFSNTTSAVNSRPSTPDIQFSGRNTPSASIYNASNIIPKRNLHLRILDYFEGASRSAVCIRIHSLFLCYSNIFITISYSDIGTKSFGSVVGKNARMGAA
jgi:hypothetical protein